jgi:hypothetical protein
MLQDRSQRCVRRARTLGLEPDVRDRRVAPKFHLFLRGMGTFRATCTKHPPEGISSPNTLWSAEAEPTAPQRSARATRHHPSFYAPMFAADHFNSIQAFNGASRVVRAPDQRAPIGGSPGGGEQVAKTAELGKAFGTPIYAVAITPRVSDE